MDSAFQDPDLTSISASPTKVSTQIKTNGAAKTLTMDHGETKTQTTALGEINNNNNLTMAHGEINSPTKTKDGETTNQTLTGDKIKVSTIKYQTKDGAIKIKALTTVHPAGATNRTQAVHGAPQTHTTGTTHSV
jgi:hypothetical protein